MIVPLRIAHARHIAHHLRDTWAREVAAGLPGHGTPDELDAWAARMVALPGESACLCADDGLPVAMGGIVPQGHVGTTWLAGTDRIGEHAGEFMRAVLRMHRDLENRGVRRFQAYCLDGPDGLFTWLGRLGYQREGRHPGMGLHGEACISFGRT